MMAMSLVSTLSHIKSNIFSCTRFTTRVRHSHSLRCPAHSLRCNEYPVSQLKPSRFKSRTVSSLGSRKFSSKTYQDIDTNIANNLLLWKYENPKYFRNLRIFACAELLIISGFSYTVYTFLPNLDKYETYKLYIKENSLLLTLMILPLLAAVVTACFIWFFEIRSLKYIILHKGGKMVSLVCSHPIKGSRTVVAPISDVAVRKGRHEPGTYMSLKLKPNSLYFVMDKDGNFINPQMFDVTVGTVKI